MVILYESASYARLLYYSKIIFAEVYYIIARDWRVTYIQYACVYADKQRTNILNLFCYNLILYFGILTISSCSEQT